MFKFAHDQMKILKLVNECNRRAGIIDIPDRFFQIISADTVSREVAEESDHHVDIVDP